MVVTFARVRLYMQTWTWKMNEMLVIGDKIITWFRMCFGWISYYMNGSVFFFNFSPPCNFPLDGTME
jgi:hypothetical protein